MYSEASLSSYMGEASMQPVESLEGVVCVDCGLIWGKIQQKCGGSIQVKGGFGRCTCGALKPA